MYYWVFFAIGKGCWLILVQNHWKTRVIMKPIELSHKSHNAPLPYPTMHHFATEIHISVTKWCIVGYLPDALLDLRDGQFCYHAIPTGFMTALDLQCTETVFNANYGWILTYRIVLFLYSHWLHAWMRHGTSACYCVNDDSLCNAVCSRFIPINDYLTFFSRFQCNQNTYFNWYLFGCVIC